MHSIFTLKEFRPQKSKSIGIKDDIDPFSMQESIELSFVVAAKEGELEKCQLMIKNGINLNASTILGTPLVCAAQGGKLDVCELLLNAGSDVNKATINGNVTPLMIAAISGHFELCKLFLAFGANTSCSSSLGPLSYYIEHAVSNQTKIYDLFYNYLYPLIRGNVELLLPILNQLSQTDSQ